MPAPNAGCGLISVAIPVYNGADYLEAALESLIAQSFENFEIVVADNASTDATASILADFARRDSRIVVHRSEEFLAQAVNVTRAVDLCSGVWVKLLCHDDLLDRRCLQCLAEASTGCAPTIGFIGHGESWLYENGVCWSGVPPKNESPLIFEGLSYLSEMCEGRAVPPLPSLTTGMVRMTAWRSTNGFDERFVHFDNFFWASLLPDWDYLYIPRRLSINRIHSAQVAVSARKTMLSSQDHNQFWPELIASLEGRFRLSWRGRLRMRLRPHGWTALGMAAELLKGRPREALVQLRSVPARSLPFVMIVLPLVFRREWLRTRDLRCRVPAKLIYP